MAQEVKIQEIENGVKITETIDGNVVEKLISYQSKPFLRTTNETDEETYQVLDIVGEIYNKPALATDFRIIDKNDNVFIPADGAELIEYSKKIRAFRPDDDRDSFHIGNITTTSNSITINLPDDGVNWAYIDGSFYEKYYPDAFNFTPVTTGQKILIIHALPDAQVFHLAQGAESTEAVSPDFQGLFIASITVSDGGQIVNPAGPQDFLYQSNDAWITQQITGAESLLVAGNNPGNTFDISVKNGTVNPGIAGITAEQKLFWEGRIFWLRNNSPVDIALTDTPVSGELTRFSLVQFEKPAVLKKAGWAAVKIKAGQLVVIGLGGGASFPEGGTRGDVLEWDAEGAAWSDRLTLAEQEIDAEVVNRAAADLQEKNERVAADALKQDKSLFSSLTDKFLHFYNATTQKLEPVLKYVAGTVAQLEFTGRIKADAIVLPANSKPAVANRLRSDGSSLFFAGDNAVETALLTPRDIVGTQNPPTLAELTAMGIKKYDYYVHTASGQRTLFNGAQLHDWTVTAVQYNAMSAAQKDAVKTLSVIF